MTTFDTIPDSAVDGILREERARLVNDLVTLLDVDAGLRDAMMAQAPLEAFPDRAVDTMLREQRARLVNDLVTLLDVDAGLRDAMITARHASLIRDLDDLLDVAVGLDTILPAQAADLHAGVGTTQESSEAGGHGRSHAWGLWTHEPIESLDNAAAGKILRDYANAGTKAEAEALAQRLGRHPFALHLAGMYLAEATSVTPDGRSSIMTFVGLLNAVDSLDVMMRIGAGDVTVGEQEQTGHASSIVDRLCTLALALLTHRGLPEARTLHRALSYTADADVPLRLFDAVATADSASLMGLDKTRMSAVLQSLADLGLIDLIESAPASDNHYVKPRSLVVRIHPLARDYSRRQAELSDHAERYLALTVTLLDRAACSGDPEHPRTWSWWHSLAPHCSSFLTLVASHPAELPMDVISKAATAAHHAARYRYARGLYEQAEREFHTVLDVRRRRLGGDSAAMLDTRHWLACALRERDQLVEAELEFRAILQERTDLLPRAHSDTTGMLSHLLQFGWSANEGSALLEIDEDEEARRALLKVFDTCQELAITLAYRAWSTEDKDQYETAAKEMYHMVYEARRRVLGDDHPDTLESRFGLAIRLYNAEQLDNAEEEFRQIFETERQLPERGDDHPTTIATLGWLAAVLQARGEMADSERIHREVHKAYQRILGNRHPQTKEAHVRLAGFLRDRGDLTEAEAICRQVYEADRQAHGEHHRETLVDLIRLANVLTDRRELAEAEAICREVYRVRRRILGAEHRETLLIQYHLAIVLEEAGQLDSAEMQYRAVLDIERRDLGDEHPSTLVTRRALAGVLVERGRQIVEWGRDAMPESPPASVRRAQPEPVAGRQSFETPRSPERKERPGAIDSSHTMSALVRRLSLSVVQNEYPEDIQDEDGRGLAKSASY